MGKFTLQTGLMAAALLATSFASAGIDFKTNLTGYNFNAEAANVLWLNVQNILDADGETEGWKLVLLRNLFSLVKA